MITITKESAMLLLDQLYKAGMVGKYSTGEYVIASETGCFGMTPEEAAEDLAPKLAEIDLLMETARSDVRSALRDITLPDLMVSDPLANSKHVITFDSETAHGEPQAWIYLKDGSSIEITHEEYCLDPNEQYFSLRHHCSEEDFENDVYHSTMGVIDECSGGLVAIAPMLQRITDAIGISDEPHDDRKTEHCCSVCFLPRRLLRSGFCGENTAVTERSVYRSFIPYKNTPYGKCGSQTDDPLLRGTVGQYRHILFPGMFLLLSKSSLQHCVCKKLS